MTEVTSPKTLDQLGDNLIALGNAIKSPSATIEELTALSAACGLCLEFRVMPLEPQ